MSERPVMIAAGGTGGHVFPALAVAEQLIQRGVPVLWIGTQRGIESRLVPEAGYEIDWITVSGLRGKGVLKLLRAPFDIAVACVQALAIIRRRNPRAVLGMGGFVSGPGGLVAWLTGRPLVIHEQNAVPGTTNRLLSRIASRILEATPGTFVEARGALCTGNPVRHTLHQLEPVAAASADAPLRVLALGGSQGARSLNRVVPVALAGLERCDIWHQCGRDGETRTTQRYSEQGVEARVDAFIDDMTAAYGWADIVVCRSGAMTVAELAASGRGAILVPYPHAIDDHQTANGSAMVRQGAALMLPEAQFDASALRSMLVELRDNRTRVAEMALAARALARPDAAADVATLVAEVAK
ncbi:MAG: undecaprenyldiphospho-muramoylpentapeptide beta-N-acetylglucosaminyltransferase [Pseudomonadota bacterium]